MGLSHIGICVPAARFDEVVAFYKAALAPLGYKEHMRPAPHVVGLGVYYPDFWISGVNGDEDGDDARDENGLKRKPIHVAFDAKSIFVSFFILHADSYPFPQSYSANFVDPVYLLAYTPYSYLHAFSDRTLVHGFYTAALAAGAKCNGAPGPRPQYHKFYYGSFVLDPVGNNIEAVCMWPAWTHWQYWFGVGVFSRKGKED